jgi:uncharacterized membrane protein YtjA (UPF0391 family)
MLKTVYSAKGTSGMARRLLIPKLLVDSYVARLAPQAANLRHAVRSPRRKESVMLHWAITLFIIAIVAAVLGFGGIAGSAAALAKICFFVFLILAIASFAFGRRAI